MSLFASFLPVPALSPYIECYWILRAPATPPPQHMPADGRVELMFSFGGASRRTRLDGSDACRVTETSFILGARSEGYHLEHVSAPFYIAVRFRVGGLTAFVDFPVAELTDIYAELSCIWEADFVRKLEDQLQHAATPEDAIAILNTELVSQLAPPDHLERLLYSVEQMKNTSTSLLNLAMEVNLSQKHFERLFTRYIGVRPSLFARMTRFQQAMYQALHHHERMNLSQLAQHAGYYDHAHFTRDFKQFSGVTPTQFLSTVPASQQFVNISRPT